MGTEHDHTETPIRPLTLTLLGGAASSQARRAARLAVVLHAGIKGGVDQARFVRQQGHGGRSGAVAGQGGDGEF